jgi:hypothetical protein
LKKNPKQMRTTGTLSDKTTTISASPLEIVFAAFQRDESEQTVAKWAA